jgi:AcrR family transcriptional regulator
MIEHQKYRSKVRQEQKEATRGQILQSALDAFAAHGYDATSVREVAGKANVNHSLVTYHFGDKAGLWRAAVDFLFERLEAELADVPPVGEVATAFENTKLFIRAYVRYCARHPEHARIMVQEAISASDRLDWANKTHTKPRYERRATVHARLVELGIYPDIPHFEMNFILAAAAQSIFTLAAEAKNLEGIVVLDEMRVDAHADAIIKLFFEHRYDGK